MFLINSYHQTYPISKKYIILKSRIQENILNLLLNSPKLRQVKLYNISNWLLEDFFPGSIALCAFNEATYKQHSRNIFK